MGLVEPRLMCPIHKDAEGCGPLRAAPRQRAMGFSRVFTLLSLSASRLKHFCRVHKGRLGLRNKEPGPRANLRGQSPSRAHRSWACPRLLQTRPLDCLLTLNRCSRVGHCVQNIEVRSGIAKCESVPRTGDGLRANKIEIKGWHRP